MARKKQATASKKQQHSAAPDVIERLHPSLRAKFFPLPESGDALTDEQLAEIFGGDLTALRDVIRLVRQAAQENVDQ